MLRGWEGGVGGQGDMPPPPACVKYNYTEAKVDYETLLGFRHNYIVTGEVANISTFAIYLRCVCFCLQCLGLHRIH